MREVAAALEAAGPRTLVLVDELGRSTSTGDGVAIAWAVAERLVDAGALALFATHFQQLGGLAAAYPAAVRVLDMQVVAKPSGLEYRWTAAPADPSAPRLHYGLALARSLGMPEALLEEAERVARRAVAASRQRQQLLLEGCGPAAGGGGGASGGPRFSAAEAALAAELQQLAREYVRYGEGGGEQGEAEAAAALAGLQRRLCGLQARARALRA